MTAHGEHPQGDSGPKGEALGEALREVLARYHKAQAQSYMPLRWSAAGVVEEIEAVLAARGSAEPPPPVLDAIGGEGIQNASKDAPEAGVAVTREPASVVDDANSRRCLNCSYVHGTNLHRLSGCDTYEPEPPLYDEPCGYDQCRIGDCSHAGLHVALVDHHCACCALKIGEW